jgi:hypothetical protein
LDNFDAILSWSRQFADAIDDNFDFNESAITWFEPISFGTGESGWSSGLPNTSIATRIAVMRIGKFEQDEQDFGIFGAISSFSSLSSATCSFLLSQFREHFKDTHARFVDRYRIDHPRVHVDLRRILNDQVDGLIGCFYEDATERHSVSVLPGMRLEFRPPEEASIRSLSFRTKSGFVDVLENSDLRLEGALPDYKSVIEDIQGVYDQLRPYLNPVLTSEGH